MSPPTARFSLLNKRTLQLLIVFGAPFLLLKGVLVLTTAQSETHERKFQSREFRDMPLRVRQVKNLQSKTWPNDFEIEVQNVSDKPIYYITGVLEFPDDPAPNGSSGILLEYGKVANSDIGRIAQTEDEHLDPGKTVNLVVSEIYRKGLSVKQEKAPQNFKKLDFWFGTISFGDGTGLQR